LGFSRDAKAAANRLKSVDPLLMPNAAQFRDARHRELLTSGVELAARTRPT